MLTSLVAAILFTTPAHLVGASPTEIAESELAAAKHAYIDARRNKHGLEEAAYKYGEIAVNSPVLIPKDKYPLSLALFRQVLAMNPDNSGAKEWEEKIVSIYASMGREPGDFDLSTIR